MDGEQQICGESIGYNKQLLPQKWDCKSYRGHEDESHQQVQSLPGVKMDRLVVFFKRVSV
jgi:hypothetical protein